MIDLDTALLEFVRTNLISIGLIIAAARIIALKLRWKWLVDILDMLKNKLPGKKNV